MIRFKMQTLLRLGLIIGICSAVGLFFLIYTITNDTAVASIPANPDDSHVQRDQPVESPEHKVQAEEIRDHQNGRGPDEIVAAKQQQKPAETQAGQSTAGTSQAPAETSKVIKDPPVENENNGQKRLEETVKLQAQADIKVSREQQADVDKHAGQEKADGIHEKKPLTKYIYLYSILCCHDVLQLSNLK